MTGVQTCALPILQAEEIAEAMRKVLLDEDLRKTMIEKGSIQAQKFAPDTYVNNMMNIYKSLKSKK